MSWRQDINDEEGSHKTYQQFEIKEAIAFLIELTPELLSPMSTNSNCSHSQLFEILSSINDLMQEMIMTSRSTGFGIYLYNCTPHPLLRSMKKTTTTFQRLFHLNVLNLQNMKKLNDIITNVDNVPLNDIFKYTPMQDETEITMVLNKMIDEFTNKKEFNKRRMVWVTTNDKPYTQESTKEAIWRIVDDFYYYGFFIEPFFLATKDRDFDFESFKEVFMNTNYLKKSQERALQQREENEELIRPVGFSKDSVVFKKSIVGSQIRQSIFRIKEVRRMQFACNLILSDNGDVGGGLGCSVKAYTLYSHEKIKKNDLLLYTREETLKKVFSTADLTQNGKKIELSKDHKKSYIDKKEEAGIRKGYPIGGSDDDVVILNKEQLEFLTNYSFDHRLQEEPKDTTDPTTDNDNNELPILFSEAPYLKLIGFRDLSKFNPIYSCGAPTFLTADLDNGRGTSALKGEFSNSLATFGSLYRSCIKLQQYAIVIGCTRSNSRPFLYAMYPTQTTNSSKLIEGEEFPQGFLLIKMPWLEDVRSLPGEYIRHTKEGASSSSQTDPELVNHFKEILPKFELENYDPKEFPNPSLNFFYKVVKHEILQMDFGPSERTLSKNDETMKRLADLKMFVNSDDSVIDTLRKINLRMNEIERTMEKKRSSVDVSEKEKEKIIKKSKPVKEITEKEMLTAWKYETMIQFSMDQLRGFRKKYPQIQSASKKADLIENITKFLDSRVRKKPT